jgi:hypothetical protein
VIAPPIYVGPDADGQALESKRVELQCALDRINERGDAWRNARE